MDAIFYVLRTGRQWKALPRSLGSGSTAHDYFQKWTREGVFLELCSRTLEKHDVLVGIDWGWLSVDGAITKAPLAARSQGNNPTDRAKSGTRRSLLLVDARGVPLSVVVDGANRF